MRLGFKTGIVAIGQLAVSAERILVVIVLSRTLSKVDYGTYQQVWLVFALLLPLFTLGLPGSILYFVPKSEKPKHKTVVYQTLALLALVGMFFSLLAFVFAPLISRQFNNPDLIVYLRIFSLYPLLSLPSKLIGLFLIAVNRVMLSAIVSAASAFVIVLATIIPSLLDWPLVYTFWGTIIGVSIVLLCELIYLSILYRDQTFHWDRGLMRSQLAYSIPLGLASVMGVISLQINKVIVSTSYTPEVYATYTNGAFEIPFISLLTGSLMTVLIPEFVTRLKDGSGLESVWRLWHQASSITAMLLFPLVIFLLVFAEDFMVLMFSEKYLDSAGVFRIYLLLVMMRITQYSALLQAMGFTRLILKTSIAGLLINLILSVVLVRVIGLNGPAWANAISMYALALIYLILISHYTQTAIRQVLPWRDLAEILGLAIIIGAIAWAVKSLNLDYLETLVLGGVLCGTSYIALLFITKKMTYASLQDSLRSMIAQVR